MGPAGGVDGEVGVDVVGPDGCGMKLFWPDPLERVKARKRAAPAAVPVAASHVVLWLPLLLSGAAVDCADAILRGAASIATLPRNLAICIFHPKERSVRVCIVVLRCH